MEQTANLNLSLYEKLDFFKITDETDSLNANMKKIDAAYEELKGLIAQLQTTTE